MDSIVDLVDDIVAGVVESRKLLQNPGGVQMRRRARRFPNVVVPSAVRQGNIARDIDLPHDMRAVAQRGYMLGIRRAHHKDTKALIAHATDPDTYEIHPKIKKLARALHDDVVRRGVKAGIFKRVAHPDKRVKEKMLVPGERSSIHARQ
jgi:hypothetical protein